jgi:hypothetical protein
MINNAIQTYLTCTRILGTKILGMVRLHLY